VSKFIMAAAATLLATTALVRAEPAVAAEPAAPACGVAIVGVTLIDGTGANARPNMTVVTANGRITTIAPKQSANVPACAQIINATGKFLVPGFIDTNVHVAMPRTTLDFARYSDKLDQLAIEGAQLHLKYGITSIHDSYGVLAPLLKARDAMRRGEVPGARLFVAGNIVGWGGSFSSSFRGKPPESYFEEWINDQYSRGSGEALSWMEPTELRKAINAYMDLGVDFVKIGLSAHDHNSPAILFSQRQLDAMVEEIHRRGLTAEVHATTPESMVMAMNAKVDLIQHPEVIGVPITDEVLGMLDQQRAICSIHTNNHAGRAWQQVISKQEADKKNGQKSEPTTLRAWDKPAPTEAMAQQKLIDDNSVTFRENAKKILQTNCIITTATDNSMGSAPDFSRDPNAWQAREPGLGTLASIEGLVELGATPMQAIVAATKNGAIALNRAKDLGTIEQGKIGDMVLLTANPLKDIAAIRKIDAVVKDGMLVDRDSLPLKPLFYRPQ
jgi:imidazolonepropionase-like amidohydrolase